VGEITFAEFQYSIYEQFLRNEATFTFIQIRARTDVNFRMYSSNALSFAGFSAATPVPLKY
jgi:hypothetical protein